LYEEIIVGGGNSAGQAAAFLSQTARSVLHACASGGLGRIYAAISHYASMGICHRAVCNSELAGQPEALYDYCTIRANIQGTCLVSAVWNGGASRDRMIHPP
jgi:hypothetical protein